MVGVLGLLTGWALLMPALLALYATLGFPYYRWMGFFLGIAGSLPMLALMTLGGLLVMALSVRSLTQAVD